MKKVILLHAFALVIATSFAQVQFDAKKIVVLSDADMAASAYLDGELKRIEGDHDLLTLIDMEEFPKEVAITTLPVSNSVTNWTKSLDVTANGEVAFVAETRGSLDRKTKRVGNVFQDLPAGRWLTAVAIERAQPETIDQIAIGHIPLVAQLSPDGQWIASVIEEAGKEIVLVPWSNNRFGEPKYFSHGKSADVRATDITWHPSGNYLAVTLEESNELAFYKVDHQRTQIVMIGTPIKIGQLPGAGQFTPDGAYYLIPDIDDWVTPGYLMSIQPDFKEGNHTIKSRIEVGRAPEGFGISPDGKKVLVANMEGAHFPYGAEAWTNGSTLSLLTLNESGILNEVDRKPLMGVLPENVVFDQDGDMAAIAIYDHNDLGQKKGAVAFWEVSGDQLRNVGFKVSVTRGAHVLQLIY